jgi:hypothetical protein
MREDEGVELIPPEVSEPSETPDSESETGPPSNGSPEASPESTSLETTGAPQ